MQGFSGLSGNVWQMIKDVLIYRTWGWISPRKTAEDKDCAVLFVDFDIKPGAIRWIMTALAMGRIFNDRINSDHQFFKYLLANSEAGELGQIKVTIRLEERRETEALQGEATDLKENQI